MKYNESDVALYMVLFLAIFGIIFESFIVYFLCYASFRSTPSVYGCIDAILVWYFVCFSLGILNHSAD